MRRIRAPAARCAGRVGRRRRLRGDNSGSARARLEPPPASTPAAPPAAAASPIKMKNIAFDPKDRHRQGRPDGHVDQRRHRRPQRHRPVRRQTSSPRTSARAARSRFTPTKAGTIKYVCTIHPGHDRDAHRPSRSSPRPQPEAAQHQQRALAERAARGQDAELDRGVVGVEERAHAPQALAGGVELAVEHDVHDDEAPGRREALELAAVRAQQLRRARRRSARRRAARRCARRARPGTRPTGAPRGRRSRRDPRAARRRAGPRSGRRARRAGRRRARSRPTTPPASGRRGRRSLPTGGVEVGQPRVRRGGLGVQPPRDAPGAAREPAGLDRARGSRGPSRPGPARARSRSRTARRRSRAPSPARRRCAVPTPASRITGTAGPLDDEREVVRVADAHARADRRAERHHRRAADVLQAAGEDRVVVGVGQHDEAVVDELLGGEQQLGRVGQQRALVADDLELDPVGLERLARQPRGDDGVARREAAGGVGQQLDAAVLERRRRASRAPPGRSAAARRSRARRCVARIASASVSSRGKPPVPRISRERSVRPAIANGVSVSGICSVLTAQPPCIARQDLDAVAVADAVRGPRRRAGRSPRRRRPRRRGRASSTPRSASSSAIVAPSRSRGLAVEADHAAAASASVGPASDDDAGPRRREALGRASRGARPASAATTSSAVTGVSRTPLR